MRFSLTLQVMNTTGGVVVGRGDAGGQVGGPGPEVAKHTPTFPVARA